jgi:hypothetical protein
MNNFDNDIIEKVKMDFNSNEIEDVYKLLKDSLSSGLNVGEGQFIRSVLFLSKGNIEQLKIILQNFDDPRDIVGEAEVESGNLGHWFAIPFNEIEQLNGELYDGSIFNQVDFAEDDGLPF